jgi:hypothetical protein
MYNSVLLRFWLFMSFTVSMNYNVTICRSINSNRLIYSSCLITLQLHVRMSYMYIKTQDIIKQLCLLQLYDCGLCYRSIRRGHKDLVRINYRKHDKMCCGVF